MKLRRHRPYPLSALAAPMAVWAVYFVVAYALVGLVCERGLLLQRAGMLPVLSWILAALTLAALAMTAWLGWNALRRWRVLRAEINPSQPREAFMRMVTVLLALLASIAVAFTATPVFLLPPCA